MRSALAFISNDHSISLNTRALNQLRYRSVHVFAALLLFLVQCGKNELAIDQKNSLIKIIGWKGNEHPSKVLADAQGNFYIIGATNSFGNGNYDGLVIKTDPAGNFLWHKTFGGSAKDYFNDGVIDLKGDLVLTGLTYSYGHPADSGTRYYQPEMYLVKMNPDGKLIWENHYWGGAGANDYKGIYDDEALCLTIDRKDNSILLAGESANFYRTGTTLPIGQAFVAYFLKLTEDGKKIWDQSFVLNERWSSCKGIVQLQDDHFLASVENFDFPEPVTLLKLNRSTGKIITAKPIQLTNRSTVTLWGVANNIAGKNVVWGSYLNADLRNELFLNGFDQELIETFRLKTPSYGFDQINANDNDFILTSFRNMISGPIIRLTRFGSDGQIIWEKDILTGEHVSRSFTLTTKNGELLVFGELMNQTTNESDFVIYTLDNEGNFKK